MAYVCKIVSSKSCEISVPVCHPPQCLGLGPVQLSFLGHLLPEIGSGLSPLKGLSHLSFSPVLAHLSPSSPGSFPGLVPRPDHCASPPTARGSGGPQDSPLQGEDLQEGEALWHLPSGHHPRGLHLQR